ncbi:MAG: DUF2225 domain-containing protein [Asgard group archaeon]|nr:DUF2225 domain-containing protein [Asgard group archaeon]
MTLIFEELYTCPNCQAIFQSKTLGSYDTFGLNYSDLYVASEREPQPVVYLINICPKCGFSAYTMDFRMNSIDMDYVDQAIQETETFSGKKATDFGAGEGYLVIAHYLRNEPVNRRTSVLLQASYAYRESKETELLKKTRELILDYIKEVIEKEAFDENPKEMYLYLAGELNRLLGKEETSLEFFKQALELTDKKSILSRVIEHQLKNPSEILPLGILKG